MWNIATEQDEISRFEVFHRLAHESPSSPLPDPDQFRLGMVVPHEVMVRLPVLRDHEGVGLGFGQRNEAGLVAEDLAPGSVNVLQKRIWRHLAMLIQYAFFASQ